MACAAQRRAQPRRGKDVEMQPKRAPGVGWPGWFVSGILEFRLPLPGGQTEKETLLPLNLPWSGDEKTAGTHPPPTPPPPPPPPRAAPLDAQTPTTPSAGL